MEKIEKFSTLADLPLGGRLLVRSLTDWRTGVIASITEEKITISITSPKGRTYRIHRTPGQSLRLENGLLLMDRTAPEEWQTNFAAYDVRW